MNDLACHTAVNTALFWASLGIYTILYACGVYSQN